MKTVLVSLIIGGSCLFIAAGYLPMSNSDSTAQVQWMQVAAPPVLQPVNLAPTGAGAADEAWQCEYFGNANLSGVPAATSTRSKLSANWRNGAPMPGLPADGFSMRCVSLRNFPALDNYQFVLRADGGVRLYVDDVLSVNDWFVGLHNLTANVTLSAGNHVLRVEYFDNSGPASLAIDWKRSYLGWEGIFFNNAAFEGAPAYKSDDSAEIADGLIFTAEREPRLGVVADDFSAIWRRPMTFQPGTYHFRLVTDGEVQVRINGQVILDTATQGHQIELDIPISVTKSLVEVHYVNKQGPATLQLGWRRTNS